MMPEHLPPPITLTRVKVTNLDRFRFQAGFWVICLVLALVLVALVGIFAVIFWNDHLVRHWTEDPRQDLTAKEFLTQQLDFTIKLAQILLINLLLPILTALIGFLFGTTVGKNQDDG